MVKEGCSKSWQRIVTHAPQVVFHSQPHTVLFLYCGDKAVGLVGVMDPGRVVEPSMWHIGRFGPSSRVY